MISRLPLKELRILIDRIDEAHVFGQLEHRRNATIVNGLCSLRKFVLDGI